MFTIKMVQYIKWNTHAQGVCGQKHTCGKVLKNKIILCKVSFFGTSSTLEVKNIGSESLYYKSNHRLKYQGSVTYSEESSIYTLPHTWADRYLWLMSLWFRGDREYAITAAQKAQTNLLYRIPGHRRLWHRQDSNSPAGPLGPDCCVHFF